MTETPWPIDVRPTSGLLKVLADDTRLRMVALLSRGEVCGGHIASALDMSQPNASQHLTVLRNAGASCGRFSTGSPSWRQQSRTIAGWPR